MICVEDWAEIRRLHRAEQMPIRAIARHLGISKNTVKRALASDRPPKYERPAKGSVVDAVEVQIRELLRETPTMPATVIAERIGWERGMTVLKERVRELRLHRDLRKIRQDFRRATPRSTGVRAAARARLTVFSVGLSSFSGLRLMPVVSHGPPPW